MHRNAPAKVLVSEKNFPGVIPRTHDQSSAVALICLEFWGDERAVPKAWCGGGVECGRGTLASCDVMPMRSGLKTGMARYGPTTIYIGRVTVKVTKMNM